MTIAELAIEPPKDRPDLWSTVGSSVRGESHIRKGVPNQDAIRWFPPLDGTPQLNPPYVIAVADGHGDARCRYSDVGSQRAVEVAIETVQELLTALDTGTMSYAEVSVTAKERLASSVVQSWRRRVQEHTEELRLLANSEDAKVSEDANAIAIPADPVKMYGTTLLVAGVSQKGLIFMQVGDGAIYSVDPTGGVSKPLRDDPATFANETTSLCSTRAEELFRVRVSPYEGNIPVAILLATDGFVNAYPDDQLPVICRQYVEELRMPSGIDEVRSYLNEVLFDASKRGSGDDTTLGILFRHDADYHHQVDAKIEEEVAASAGEAALASAEMASSVGVPSPPDQESPLPERDVGQVGPSEPVAEASLAENNANSGIAHEEAIPEVPPENIPRRSWFGR